MLFEVSNRQLFLLFSLFVVCLGVSDLVEAEAVEDGATGMLSVAKIHGPHVLIVKVFNGKVGQQSPVSELMACQVDLLP